MSGIFVTFGGKATREGKAEADYRSRKALNTQVFHFLRLHPDSPECNVSFYLEDTGFWSSDDAVGFGPYPQTVRLTTAALRDLMSQGWVQMITPGGLGDDRLRDIGRRPVATFSPSVWVKPL